MRIPCALVKTRDFSDVHTPAPEIARSYIGILSGLLQISLQRAGPGCHSEARPHDPRPSPRRSQGRGIYRRFARGPPRQPAQGVRWRQPLDEADRGAAAGHEDTDGRFPGRAPGSPRGKVERGAPARRLGAGPPRNGAHTSQQAFAWAWTAEMQRAAKIHVGKSSIGRPCPSVHIRFSRHRFCVRNFSGEWDHPSARQAAPRRRLSGRPGSMFSRPIS